MNELSLFTGAGAGLLATNRLLCFKCVCAVEIDEHCRNVLLQRQRDGIFEPFPIWDDVRTFDGLPWRGCVDIVTAGFPCQPFSTAGQRKGKDDYRNGWPDTIRIIREVQPKYVLLENVPNILNFRYFIDTILRDLAVFVSDSGGGWIRSEVLSAASVGASHIRRRLWILANTGGLRVDASQIQQKSDPEQKREAAGCGIWKMERSDYTNGGTTWPVPDRRVWGVADGSSERVDEWKAVGNGWVPQVAAAFWRMVME